MKPNNPPRLNVEGPERATTVKPIQSTRYMKFLTIHKNELENISSLNTHVAVFSSFGAFFISQTLSIILNSLTSGVDNLDGFGHVLLYFGAPLTFILSCGFFIFAYLNRGTRNSIIKRIEDESGESS